MDDRRVGKAFQAVHVKSGLRQSDVAEGARVSRGLISLIERGNMGRVSLRTLRSVASVLEIRLDLAPAWRGAALDRLLDAAHAALQESVVLMFGTLDGWEVAPEVSFSIYGERGVIDLLAWHASTRTLVVIELKTQIVDIQDLVGSVDKKRRLARRVARGRGWDARSVGCWVIVSDSRTNERHVREHRAVMRVAFLSDGHAARSWLAAPNGVVAALSLWSSYANQGGAKGASRHPTRVRIKAVKA